MVRSYSEQDKDKIQERVQSRPVHKQKAIATNIKPPITATPVDDTILPTSHPFKSVTQKDDVPAEISFPFLGEDGANFEDDQWSPGVVLARILEMKDESERERYYSHIRRNISVLSLPIITIHYLLRGRYAMTTWVQQDFTFHRKVRAFLDSRCINLNRVDKWAWILSGRTPDEMAERLLSKPRYYPPFILLEILRRDISQVKTLEMLLRYTKDYILNLDEPSRSSVPENQTNTSISIDETSESDVPTPLRKDHLTNTEPQDFRIEQNGFAILISRLLYQVRRIWPPAMVDVAHMIARYMQSIPVSSVSSGDTLGPRTFIRFSRMNNYFLGLLALPSSVEPMKSMAYNWSAQKILLELAGQFDPPLRLDHISYRAIIQVLAATKKSTRESRSVTFRNRSWPPWRVEQDGMDAQRSQEEDFSRVILAIMRSRESGYMQDHQLSIFGGVDSDGTPTIHTRKLFKWRYLESLTQGRDSHDDDAKLWAARIEATRDVHEAWGAFTEYCGKGGKATISMYLAMFQKLNYESRRLGSQSNLHVPPGDGREVLPVSDDNFSEFYKSRLQPPTIQNLYQEMRAAGIRPSGRCLSFLLRHARTIDEGLGYLLDSGMNEQVVAYLADGGQSQVPPDVIARVSDQMLTDLISLICRFAPRIVKTSSDPKLEIVEHVRNTTRSSSPTQSAVWTIRDAGAGRPSRSRPRHPLEHAAFLLNSWQPKFRPAWYALLKSLARRDIVIVRDLATDSEGICENHELAWRVTMAVLEDFHSCELELDPEGFRLVCFAFAKYAEAAFLTSERHRNGLIETSQIIKAECAKLTDGSEEGFNGNSKLRYIMEGVHLHAYVRAMGFIRDHAAIISLLQWMVKNHKELDAIAFQSANGHRMLRQTIVVIKAFCGGTDYIVATARALVEQVESWGGWPSEEDVENYLDREHNQLRDYTSAELDDGEGDDQSEKDEERSPPGSGN
ncbi:hypothetical protein N431DRAFT_346055 [Stipitochalara longipes BDJ]|nr:hypothetical protein N431DRAFT_346055 [Stipitochalara longipes BDJ]